MMSYAPLARRALVQRSTTILLPSLLALLLAVPSCGDGKSGDGDGGDGSSQGGSSTGGGLNLGTGGGIDVDGDGDPDPLPANCADGILNEDEACDDGNAEDGDGCLGNCTNVEPGFTCSVPGEACKPFAKCGDGIVSFPEQCDDKNAETPGCSASCKVEIGFKCSGSPSTCEETTCGDGIQEGSESCDDANAVPFDGCDARCQAEPYCGVNGCQAVCGDGVVLNEACDDGNADNGDGCSSTCEIEEGYECAQAPCEEISGKCVLRIPAVFRDFSEAHSDFEVGCGNQVDGVVSATLNSKGKPTLARADNGDVCITGAASFAQWYTNVAGTNGVNVGEVVLFDNGSGSYVNRFGANGEKYNGIDGNPLFFPVDNAANDVSSGQYATAKIPQEVYGGSWADESPAVPHNFHFTSEVTYWFQYDASAVATLTFTGDDDVWVFINRKLAVDLGGLHVPISKSVTVSSATAGTFGLADGKVYEIKVFHAERKKTGSSFQLTLAGFNTSRSECLPNCGDGIIGAGEQCDDGVNDGGYNECQAGCILGGYCGDGIRQSDEACDDKEVPAINGCKGCRVIIVK